VPEQQVAIGAAQIGIDWVASLLAHQEQGLPLIEIAQIYQNSGLVLVSKKESGIATGADLKGKKVGNWMGGNEFEVLALFDKYGLDPTRDLEFIKQGFTMDQFLSGELDAASAMTYNEYLVVLDAGVPAEELSVIDMNAEGVAMLEDNLFANVEWLEDNKETAAKFVRASLKGWKDAIANPEEAVDIVMKAIEEGSTTREHQLNMMKEVAKLVVPEGFDEGRIGEIDDAKFKQTADIALRSGQGVHEGNHRNGEVAVRPPVPERPVCGPAATGWGGLTDGRNRSGHAACGQGTAAGDGSQTFVAPYVSAQRRSDDLRLGGRMLADGHRREPLFRCDVGALVRQHRPRAQGGGGGGREADGGAGLCPADPEPCSGH